MRICSTKKQKNLKAGTLYKKAKDEIYDQTAQNLRFLKIGNVQFFNEI